MTRVGVIDCGFGNLASVRNAFEHLEVPVETVWAPAGLAACSHLVLPGVGCFQAGMGRLRARGLDEAIRREVAAGKPLLGLCLGMQLLAAEGSEFEPAPGLGLVPGRVVRLAPEDGSLRLPHIGWNDVAFRGPSPLLEGMGEGAAFYFVHSYGFEDADAPMVRGVADYGGAVVACIEQGHVFGAQFHPEKSQAAGLALLGNFAALC